MYDEEEFKRRVEEEIRRHHWADDEAQRVLLEVAKAYVWRQGLWARMKFAVNVIGLLGIIGGASLALASVIGFEIVRVK